MINQKPSITGHSELVLFHLVRNTVPECAGGEPRRRREHECLPRDRGHRHEHRVVGACCSQRGRDRRGDSPRIRVAEVTRQDVTIENGQVTGYRVRLAISFKYESDS